MSSRSDRKACSAVPHHERSDMTRDLTIPALAVALIVSLALGVVLPVWLVFLLTIGLAKGLVALGLVVMMRAGLVSFG